MYKHFKYPFFSSVLFMMVAFLAPLQLSAMAGGGGCTFQSATHSYADLPDALCNSPSVTPNGSCVTSDNTGEIMCVNGGCTTSGNSQTFLQFTADSPNVDVIINSLGIQNADVAILSNGNNCPPGGSYSSQCPNIGTLCILDCQTTSGGGSDTASASNLVVGETYYIMVESANADEGQFEICVESYTNPMNCTDNEDCGSAQTLNLNQTMGDTSYTCFTDCNTGASTESITFTGACNDITNANTVYYDVTSTNYFMDVIVNSTDISDLQIVIYDGSSGCSTFYQNGCVTGNPASVTQFAAQSGNNYTIMITGLNSEEGNFDLCVYNYPDPAACNVSDTMTASVAPDSNGYYQPGTTVEFCYHIDTFLRVSCNYLHGIVPSWGGCWDDASFTITQSVTNNDPDGEYLGSWIWETDPVTNNVTGDTVNPDGGWFFLHQNGVGPSDGSDPNTSWGDGCSSAMGGSCPCAQQGFTWDVCFELTTKSLANCVQDTSCDVSIKTWADGQTGGWTDVSCGFDVPYTLTSALNCPLPIQLTTFGARPLQNNQILLHWNTASETNCAYYDVQRSGNGEDFKKIGEVPAEGNTITGHDYKFVDILPLKGRNYYRLRQVDKDGSVNLSHTISLAIKGSYEFSIKNIQPSPARSHVNVSYDAAFDGQVDLMVYDVTGQKVHQSKLYSKQGENGFFLDVSNFNKGVYLILLENERGQRVQSKFLKYRE